MSEYNPASLAYLGDAVFELFVRYRQISEHNVKSGRLHMKTVELVNAGTQAKIADKLYEVLDEEEKAVYKRGRNAAVHSPPKSATLSEYCRATALEAVFGYLYLEKKMDRITELFEFCMNIAASADEAKGN